MLSAFLSLILSVLCACGKVALNYDWSNFHFVTYRANGFCVCYRSTITREKFEELCEDLWEQALTPVKEVLAHSDMKIDDIYAVELIGGATRVPKLQVNKFGYNLFIFRLIRELCSMLWWFLKKNLKCIVFLMLGYCC